MTVASPHRRSLLRYLSILSLATLFIAAGASVDGAQLRDELLRTLIVHQHCQGNEGLALTNPAFSGNPGSKGALPVCEALSHGSWWRLVEGALVTSTKAGEATGATLESQLPSALQKIGAPALFATASNPGLQEINPRALEAIFSLFYVPPSERIGGVPAQAIYDDVLAPTLRPLVDVLAKMQQTPDLFDAVVARVRANPESDHNLTYTALAYELADGQFDLEVAKRVGFLVRRALDGSLPTLRQLLEKVLHAYDPNTLKRLQAPASGLVVVKLRVEPVDVTYSLSVNGEQELFARELGFVLVHPGKHSFSFEPEEGAPLVLERVIGKTSGELKVTLPRDRWKVYVQVMDNSADILVDGERVSQGSLYHVFTFGKHVIETAGPCVVPDRIELTVSAEARPDDVELSTSPRMAELRINLVDSKGMEVPGTWWGFGQRIKSGESAQVPVCWTSTAIYWPDGSKTLEKLELNSNEPTVLTIRR